MPGRGAKQLESCSSYVGYLVAEHVAESCDCYLSCLVAVKS